MTAKKEKPVERRRRLHRLYSANAALFFPELAEFCPCPICLTGFKQAAVEPDSLLMDIAHVFPQSCGGRNAPKVLTCKQCNSRIGREYESHFARDAELVSALDGSGKGFISTRVYLPDGSSLGTTIRKLGDVFHFDIVAKQTNPADRDRMFSNVQQTGKLAFSLNMDVPDPKRYPVALLHSAYLTHYWYFGLEYCLAANTDWIREILTADHPPDEVPFMTFEIPTGWLTVDRNDLLFMPFVAITQDNTRVLGVAFPSADSKQDTRLVLLPGFGPKAMEDYKRLHQAWDSGQQKVRFVSEFHPPELRLANRECRDYGRAWWSEMNRKADASRGNREKAGLH